MFEKWRIKERMEVIDTTGRNVATVDKIDGEDIMIKRKDQADSLLYYLELSNVERVAEGRVYLKADLVFPHDVPPPDIENDARTSSDYYAENYRDGRRNSSSREDPHPFRTSGRGTGMGGSGVE